MSKVDDIGTTPDLLKEPVVGFKPTREFALEGESIEPEVSDPTATAAKFAAIDAPQAELEPPVPKSKRPYGFSV